MGTSRKVTPKLYTNFQGDAQLSPHYNLQSVTLAVYYRMNFGD